MTRLFVLATLLSTLACGSSSPKETTKVRASPTDTSKADDAAKEADKDPNPSDTKGTLTLDAAPFEIPNGRLYDGYIVGGLPTKEAIDKAIDKEIDSAMSLMDRDEKGISVIGPYAASKGFRYIRFTIKGKEDLNESMAWQFASTLPLLDKPSIIHSAHGNRVGAIFALMAFFVEDKPAEEAFAIGQAIGLGEFESHVRGLLELPSS